MLVVNKSSWAGWGRIMQRNAGGNSSGSAHKLALLKMSKMGLFFTITFLISLFQVSKEASRLFCLLCAYNVECQRGGNKNLFAIEDNLTRSEQENRRVRSRHETSKWQYASIETTNKMTLFSLCSWRTLSQVCWKWAWPPTSTLTTLYNDNINISQTRSFRLLWNRHNAWYIIYYQLKFFSIVSTHRCFHFESRGPHFHEIGRLYKQRTRRC